MISHITDDLGISSDDSNESDEEQIKHLATLVKNVSLYVQKVF